MAPARAALARAARAMPGGVGPRSSGPGTASCSAPTTSRIDVSSVAGVRRDRGPRWGRASPPNDLIRFRRRFGRCDLTSLVERVSRLKVLLPNVDRRTTPIMARLAEVLAEVLGSLPFGARRSVTFDRGSEFIDGPHLQAHAGVETWLGRPALALVRGARSRPSFAARGAGCRATRTRGRSQAPSRGRSAAARTPPPAGASGASGGVGAGRGLPRRGPEHPCLKPRSSTPARTSHFRSRAHALALQLCPAYVSAIASRSEPSAATTRRVPGATRMSRPSSSLYSAATRRRSSSGRR